MIGQNNGQNINNNCEKLENIISNLFVKLRSGVSKIKGSVRGGILKLIGILSNRYPSYFNNNNIKSLSKYYIKYISEAGKDYTN